MSKSKIVDLEMGSDGSYSPRDIKIKSVVKHKYTDHNRPKYVQNREVDEFLAGMDVGLNFLDEIVPRVDRFLRLRG
jgi:hypothetical protein